MNLYDRRSGLHAASFRVIQIGQTWLSIDLMVDDQLIFDFKRSHLLGGSENFLISILISATSFFSALASNRNH
jgi:hypothetical protein